MSGFQNTEEILTEAYRSDLRRMTSQITDDRLLKSTGIEEMIYKDLYNENEELQAYEKQGEQKMKTFKSLIQDIFQSVYGINLKYRSEVELSPIARRLNKPILSDVMADENYAVIKSCCEGKELPAMGATEELTEALLGKLDQLLQMITGGNGKIDALDLLEQSQKKMAKQLLEYLEQRQERSTQPEKMDKEALRLANRIAGKAEQKKLYEKLIETRVAQYRAERQKIVQAAMRKAAEKAQEIESILLAWGNDSGEMKKTPFHTDLLKRVSASEKLRYIAKFLGRFKKMLAEKRMNGYTYGRGQKYDITYGSDISKALTSELALLARTETIPLFLKKYRNSQIKQYRKREPEYKGKGDIVVCLDESQSTYGENNAYGMAIAMLMYEICKVNHTNFALIHFSKATKVDFFPKDKTVPYENILNCAETFLSGGTNFVKPLKEFIKLSEEGKFNKADIVFITDGICNVPEEFLREFQDYKRRTGAKLTGILLDKGQNIPFTLEKLADHIYRTSELLREEIVGKLLDKRI